MGWGGRDGWCRLGLGQLLGMQLPLLMGSSLPASPPTFRGCSLPQRPLLPPPPALPVCLPTRLLARPPCLTLACLSPCPPACLPAGDAADGAGLPDGARQVCADHRAQAVGTQRHATPGANGSRAGGSVGFSSGAASQLACPLCCGQDWNVLLDHWRLIVDMHCTQGHCKSFVALCTHPTAEPAQFASFAGVDFNLHPFRTRVPCVLPAPLSGAN